MRKILIIAFLASTLVAALLPAAAVAIDPNDARRKAEIARHKAEHARRMAEHKRQMSASAPHRGLPPASSPAGPTRDFRGNPVGSTTTADTPRDFRGNTAGAAAGKPQAPPFNASSAPPPEDSLRAMIAAGKSAGSMDQLLHFLPQEDQQQLKERQANYDPREAAASRERWRQRDPHVSEKSLARLTNSPFTNEFDRLKSICTDILDILSVKTEGNKATIVVSTTDGATVGGENYEYGKATIELVGEGNAWKFSSYSDSAWVFKDRPYAPKTENRSGHQ